MVVRSGIELKGRIITGTEDVSFEEGTSIIIAEVAVGRTCCMLPRLVIPGSVRRVTETTIHGVFCPDVGCRG